MSTVIRFPLPEAALVRLIRNAKAEGKAVVFRRLRHPRPSNGPDGNGPRAA